MSTATPQAQLTLLLVGCRHAEALIDRAEGKTAERAALTFARDVLRALHPVCPDLRRPADLDAARFELHRARHRLQRLGTAWWERPETASNTRLARAEA